MKLVISVLVAAYLATGCVSGGNIPHEDSPGVTKRDAGPVLCRDGTTPPCNDRD
jgi:hypothetical protein